MAFIPSDPRFVNQWHLLNNTPGEYDLRVVDVWDDYSGDGVQVVGLDRGFDFTHPDYDNYNMLLDWDFRDNDGIPLPAFDPDVTDDDDFDAHGTPILGIIGAALDGEGTVGIAFDAEIIGYRTSWGRDEVEAAIELATVRNHDIITMSYGEGSRVFQYRDGLVDAAEAAAEDGRDGLGMIVVKSAGNSRRDKDIIYREETTGEALENARHTIVVAGVSDEGELPPIANQFGLPEGTGGIHKSSSPGANILTTAFYGRAGDSVQTTDITGAQGYSNDINIEGGNYTGFTGTSAAAPQVAGVIALILEANPNLGWRDVQDIIAYSSRHIGSEVGELAEGEEQATQTDGSTWFWNDASNWNGGGLHYSNDFGFGLIDAKAAVRLAETWTTQKSSSNEVNPTRVDALDQSVIIAEGSHVGGVRSFFARFTDGIQVENITLGISFDVDQLEDLEVYLISPGGTRVQLISGTGDNEQWDGYWRFGSTAFRGESSEGFWRIEIRDRDNAVSSPVTINDIDLWTHGAEETNADLFIITNEFGKYAGVDGHSTNFAGGTGHDTFNSAAHDDGVILDLENGVGFVGGHQITMSSIQTVYTGDGGDRVHDGSGANVIHTGRGNDTLRDIRGGGFDEFHGQQGNDTFEVFSTIGGDAFYGGTGRDLIDWSHSAEVDATFDLAAGEARDTDGNVETMSSIADLIGTAQDDTIIESGVANEIDGHDGDDTVIVTTGIVADSFTGGDGTDTIDWSAVDEHGARFDMATGTARDSDGNTEVMAGFENLIGTDNNDVIVENTQRNVIDAGEGDDIVQVISLITSDVFRGGFGNDTIDWSGSAQANGTYNLAAGTATIGNSVETMFGFENFFGTAQRDIIIEGAGVNVIAAGGGSDIVMVNTEIGGDTFNGGTGVDTINWSGSSQENGIYDLGNNIARAGSESEAMVGFEGFIGTEQDDEIIESASANAIHAGGGDDVIRVNTLISDDNFNGGLGRNLIDWSGSAQVNGFYDMAMGRATANGQIETMVSFSDLIGTNQSDTILENGRANNIDAGGGNDTIFVTSLISSDVFAGGQGIDTIDWSGSQQAGATFDLLFGVATANGQGENMSGFEIFIGTDQNDTIFEGFATQSISAGGGNDMVSARSDTLAADYDGGAGEDHITWENVTLDGATFNLQNGSVRQSDGSSAQMNGFEDLTGTGARDGIRGSSGANEINGLGGDDRIFGRAGDDILDGGDGDDRLRGDTGADTLRGGAGNDFLRGGAGGDLLIDGDGADNLLGQLGNDVFDFGVDGFVDRVRDFTQGDDLIRLEGFNFAGLTITDMANGHIRVAYGTDSLIIRDEADVMSASDLTSSDFLFA